MSKNEGRRTYFKIFKRFWRATHRGKVRAENAMRALRQKGALPPLGDCSFQGCPKKATERHHPDYRRPKVVKGYCRRHHYLLHQLEKALRQVA